MEELVEHFDDAPGVRLRHELAWDGEALVHAVMNDHLQLEGVEPETRDVHPRITEVDEPPQAISAPVTFSSVPVTVRKAKRCREERGTRHTRRTAQKATMAKWANKARAKAPVTFRYLRDRSRASS